MRAKAKYLWMLLPAALTAVGVAAAAEGGTAAGQEQPGTSGMMQGGRTHDGMAGGGMMGSGMMHGGMMGGGMMGHCSRMMRGGSPASLMPQLPAGNEKLQLQMQAEMMQKMGEILSKYAARIPDHPPSAR